MKIKHKGVPGTVSVRRISTDMHYVYLQTKNILWYDNNPRPLRHLLRL